MILQMLEQVSFIVCSNVLSEQPTRDSLRNFTVPHFRCKIAIGLAIRIHTIQKRRSNQKKTKACASAYGSVSPCVKNLLPSSSRDRHYRDIVRSVVSPIKVRGLPKRQQMRCRGGRRRRRRRKLGKPCMWDSDTLLRKPELSRCREVATIVSHAETLIETEALLVILHTPPLLLPEPRKP